MIGFDTKWPDAHLPTGPPGPRGVGSIGLICPLGTVGGRDFYVPGNLEARVKVRDGRLGPGSKYGPGAKIRSQKTGPPRDQIGTGTTLASRSSREVRLPGWLDPGSGISRVGPRW